MSAKGEGGGSGRRGPGAGRPGGDRRGGDVADGNPRELGNLRDDGIPRELGAASVAGLHEPNAPAGGVGPGDSHESGVLAGGVGSGDSRKFGPAAGDPRGFGSGRSSAAPSSPSSPRRRRAAVRLSRVDAERLARGEISSPEEALHLDDPKATRSAMRGEERRGVVARDAGERYLLENRPPHFGSL